MSDYNIIESDCHQKNSSPSRGGAVNTHTQVVVAEISVNISSTAVIYIHDSQSVPE